jgi:hypothetical protein
VSEAPTQSNGIEQDAPSGCGLDASGAKESIPASGGKLSWLS